MTGAITLAKLTTYIQQWASTVFVLLKNYSLYGSSLGIEKDEGGQQEMAEWRGASLQPQPPH
jgi:hypothetical protein